MRLKIKEFIIEDNEKETIRLENLIINLNSASLYEFGRGLNDILKVSVAKAKET